MRFPLERMVHVGNLSFHLPSSRGGRGQDQWLCKLALIQHLAEGHFSQVDAVGLERVQVAGLQNDHNSFLEELLHASHSQPSSKMLSGKILKRTRQTGMAIRVNRRQAQLPNKLSLCAVNARVNCTAFPAFLFSEN